MFKKRKKKSFLHPASHPHSGSLQPLLLLLLELICFGSMSPSQSGLQDPIGLVPVEMFPYLLSLIFHPQA